MAQAAQARQIAKRDQLVLDHQPLVKAIALDVHRKLPQHVDLDDLISAGLIGLLDAIGKFNAGKKVPFSSYAKYRIKGAILDSLRQLDCASRDSRRVIKQIESAVQELARTLGRYPTEAETAEQLEMDLDCWREMQVKLRGLGSPLSLSTRDKKHDDLPAPDVASCEARPDELLMNAETRQELAAAMRTLPDRYRKVMELYYWQELPMSEVGRRLGVNESRISQIHKLALGKLRSAMIGQKITSARAFGAAA